MTKKIIKNALRAVILFALALALGGSLNLISINQAMAGDGNWWSTVQNGGLNQVGQAYGAGQPRDARLIVVDFIKIILGFLGILAMVLILYAGFKWMISRGNEEEVGTAKKILVAGVIGLVIILCSYIIANFVINQIYGATTGAPVMWGD